MVTQNNRSINSRNKPPFSRQQKRLNELDKLQTKLERPLNCVEIDSLYRGYRKLDKCTKRKNCQCYHCELLKLSPSSNESSGESSGFSTGSDDIDNESDLFTFSCFKAMSGARVAEADGLPNHHKKQKSCLAMPRTEYFSSLSDDNTNLSFSKAQKKNPHFCSWMKRSVALFWIAIIYFLRWLCCGVNNLINRILCKRQSRKICPTANEEFSKCSFNDRTKDVTQNQGAGDNDEDLICVSVHKIPSR